MAEALEPFIRHEMSDKRLPALSIALVDDQDVIWARGFGHLDERKTHAAGPDTLFSSGLNPAGGKAEPVPDGFRVSGRWGFSSGCDAASWLMVAVPGPHPNDLIWLLLPRADYQILDTWFASGMRGWLAEGPGQAAAVEQPGAEEVRVVFASDPGTLSRLTGALPSPSG